MTIIRVENLGKEYIISHKTKSRSKYIALRDVITNNFLGNLYLIMHPLALLNKNRTENAYVEKFWAVKDVNFELNEGERVGIIGRNGTGKSTILKLLSRITEPTTGKISIKGRVASLLEVGTGFHPELTGRENIMLNGAILGMTRKEINNKFDEIVDFAEIERFLDTPVKRYSSGMYVRLAFAVAANLDPEILLVDEVLAVGDIKFQKKCLGKMENVAKEGRTILFVSHNMETIQRLCNRVILLGEGKIIMDGPTNDVVNHYIENEMSTIGEKIWPHLSLAPGDETVKLHSVRIKDKQNNICTSFDVRDPIVIEMEYIIQNDNVFVDAEVILVDKFGHNILYSVDNLDSPWYEKGRVVGKYKSICYIPGDFLNEGQISVTIAVSTIPHTCHAVAKEVVNFEVNDCMDPNGVRGDIPGIWPTVSFRPRLKWEVSLLRNS